jgi:hypothetical protein
MYKFVLIKNRVSNLTLSFSYKKTLLTVEVDYSLEALNSLPHSELFVVEAVAVGPVVEVSVVQVHSHSYPMLEYLIV